MRAAVLETRGLGRDYGYRRALESFDLALAAGDLGCVLGPNGAGKSTLLSALSTSRPPERGEILHENVALRSGGQRRAYLAGIGYLGHDPGLIYDFTARENLNFFASLYGRPSAGPRAVPDVDRLLERTGLAARKDEPARNFSRGLKQRLGLCRVFLNAPQIVLLDEPLTGLDRAGVEVLRRLLIDHRAAGGVALLATHDDEPFREIATRFLFIRDGRLVADIPRERYDAAARAKAEALLYDSDRTGAA